MAAIYSIRTIDHAPKTLGRIIRNKIIIHTYAKECTLYYYFQTTKKPITVDV